MHRVEQSEITKLVTWDIRFTENDFGKQMAWYAVHKTTWNDFYIATDRETAKPLGLRYGADIDRDLIDNINMRGVSVERCRHGTCG